MCVYIYNIQMYICAYMYISDAYMEWLLRRISRQVSAPRLRLSLGVMPGTWLGGRVDRSPPGPFNSGEEEVA